MSDSAPKARIKRLSDYVSPVWFVPLLAALIGLWMLFHTLAQRGPEVTLTIQNADGIEAGTRIRARSVEVGQVESVELSDDASHAVMRARMTPDAARLLGEDAQFWVVKPRIGRDGISGLGTVLSGAYIELQPDTSGEGDRDEFRVLDQPPVAPSDAAGLRIRLDSTNGNALSVGDPVVFQGYTVGRVEASNFDAEKRVVHYDLYIFSNYTSLVTANTHFWVTSGVNFDITSEGVNLNVGSLETLISGGVTFDVAEGVDPGQPVEDGAAFDLFSNEEQASLGSYNQYLEYVLLLDDSIRGLSAGAPVEYRGVRVGTVETLPWRINRLADNHLSGFRIPVLIRIEPQRLQPVVTEEDLQRMRQTFGRMIDNGMRASLATANLVTGALYIDLDFVGSEDDDTTQVANFEGKPVFPSTQSGFGQVTGKVSALLDKVNQLDIESTITNLNATLDSSNALVQQLNTTTEGLNQLLNDPAMRSLPGDVQSSLQAIEHTLQGFDPQAPAYRDLRATIQQLDQLLRSLQPAARTISDKPNSLIFNRGQIDDPQPRARQ
ncbi:intermembrane transport protein PqiB [Halotalea alkalilenta]|uniref:Mammalian cell entry protein n=1 Tax=Halotalea alkalilenta TaxID=376489 RepID=A0A172YB56_9GAMM|nr:intermembrane transport protein PqiB [Halotalea alkalilenta]ANF56458.1 mammalian cell entry protein [Halotalea alkalilenta]